TRPALDQPITLPCMSVIETCVLLNVARMFATPVMMFLAPLALTIFLAFGSSPSSSAAVGAATTGAAPGSPGLASAAGAAAPSAAAAAFAFFGLAGAASPAAAGALASALSSFFAAGFFFSSAILQIGLMDARLGVWIALHADRLARTFARARVRRSTLAAHRQSTQVTNAAITLDRLKT